MREPDGNLRQVWSEADLDDALAALHNDDRTDPDALAHARARLLNAAGPDTAVPDTASPNAGTAAPEGKPRASWRPWLTAAAVAGVLAVGGGVAYYGVSDDRVEPVGPTVTAAGRTLSSAAARLDEIGARDERPAPGQYRYISTHAWWLYTTEKGDRTFSRLTENLIETWVPANPAGEWLERRSLTGERKWVVGTEQEAIDAGVPMEESHGDEQRAPCGDYYAEDSGQRPCMVPGGWQHPTPEWIAAQPRDPERLLAKLTAETEGRGDDPEQEILVYAADALRTGLLPADLRSALYQALARLPSLDVTDGTANLDGRRGTALGITADGTRRDIIVDRRTGQFIGERTVELDGHDAAPPGTVTAHTSVRVEIADRIGVRPGR